MNGGVFYTDQRTEIIVDTFLTTPIPSQNVLLDSLRRCNDLVQRDMRYAHIVAGASKMPMSMIWTSRNQDELVNDTDLAKLKDLAWNEFIQKRYLPAITGGDSLASTAASLLDIVREMNLQRRRFQIMGLHEQVEASEIQLVLHLCQAQILRPSSQNEYRSLANRFRRHDRFYEAFALAVGAFVCSSAPFTLGAATTRYERDLQYEYKKHTTALFVYVLQQHTGAIGEAGAYDEDYVLRISRLIVVWPDGGGGGSHGGVLQSFPGPPPPPDEPIDKDLLLNAVAAAQTQSDKAQRMASKAEREMRRSMEGVERGFATQFDAAKKEVDGAVQDIRDRLDGIEGGEVRRHSEEQLRNATQMHSLQQTIFLMMGVRADSSGAATTNLFESTKNALKEDMKVDFGRIDAAIARLDEEMRKKGLHADTYQQACNKRCDSIESELRSVKTAVGVLETFKTRATDEINKTNVDYRNLVNQLNGIASGAPPVAVQPPSTDVALGTYVHSMDVNLTSWAGGLGRQLDTFRAELTALANRLAGAETITNGTPALTGRITAVELRVQTSEETAVNNTSTMQRQQTAIAANTEEIANTKQTLNKTSEDAKTSKTVLETLKPVVSSHTQHIDNLLTRSLTSEANLEFIRTFMDWDENDSSFKFPDTDIRTLDQRVLSEIQEHSQQTMRAEHDRNAVFAEHIPPGWMPEVRQLVAEALQESSRPGTARGKRAAELDAESSRAASPMTPTSAEGAKRIKPNAATDAAPEGDGAWNQRMIQDTVQQTVRRILPDVLASSASSAAMETRVRALEQFMRAEDNGVDLYDRPQSPMPDTADYT